MTAPAPIIAACGLDCAACDIYRAGHDPALAQQLTEHFRAHGRPAAEPAWFHCSTCRGEQSRCWSGDCWIRRCAVTERGLENCSQCGEFPCTRLSRWAAQNARYAAALERLREMANPKMTP